MQYITEERENLVYHFADKIQSGGTLKDWIDQEHNLISVMEAVYVDTDKCEEINALNQRLADNSMDVTTQIEILEEFNSFVAESIEWYVREHFNQIDRQYKYEQEADQADFATKL